jgi:hypothetical protein
MYVCFGGELCDFYSGEGRWGACVRRWAGTLWDGKLVLVVIYVFCVYLILLVFHTLFAIFTSFLGYSFS